MKLLLLCLCVAAVNAELARLITSKQRTVPDSWIIKLKDAELVDKVAAEIEDKFSVARLRTPEVTKIRKLLPALTLKIPAYLLNTIRAIDGIEYVHEDTLGTIYGTQSGATWGIDRVDSRTGTDSVFRYNNDVQGNGANIYIVDTGIQTTHTVFGGRAVKLFGATDDHGHGTHCAGTSGGHTYGLAREANIYGVKVCDSRGYCSISDVLNGLDTIVEHGKPNGVVSMSLGWPDNKIINQAAKDMVAKGYTLSVAAGNENANACYVSPAQVPEVITVGASDSNDNRASFSNYGSCLDLFAPGVGITSAKYNFWSNYGTTSMSGTSMACPHVTGAAALYLGKNPGASPAAVHAALVNAATSGAISNVQGSPNKLLYVNYT